MLTRIMTSVIGIPLVIAIIVIGNPWLKYVIMAVSLIAMYEFYRVIKTSHKPMIVLGYAAVVIHYLAFDLVMQNYYIFMTLLTVLTLSVLVIRYPKYSIVDVALTIFPVLYVSLLFSFIILLRDVKDGSFWVWLIAIGAWGCDTFAYFTGKTIGKHKLAPELSPKKTIEGSIGGIIGAGLLGYLYTIIYSYYFSLRMNEQVAWVVLAVMLGAFISQFGDLAASAIKRHFKQKDYGYILPGHGGILDRFDSFLFVSPMIYIIVIGVQSMMG